MSFKSEFSKIKSRGSSSSGVHHWWSQRFTAICLIFLVIWFVMSLTGKISQFGGVTPHILVRDPIDIISLILLILVAIHHANLGIQVVFEDYVSCKCLRVAMIVAVKIISYASAFAAVFGLIELYLS